MLDMIEFKNGRFRANKDSKGGEDYSTMEFTKNTVVICNNPRIMAELAQTILLTVNGQAEENDYYCDSEDVGAAVIDLAFGLQRVIKINDQTITLGIEPALVYKAEDIEDLWFLGEDISDGKMFAYPLYSFIGSHDLWSKGKAEVYKSICNGNFGCYDGSWVAIGPVK